MDVYCPHCEKDALDVVDKRGGSKSDWLYDNDLYTDENVRQVECPACDEKFFVRVGTTFVYDTEKTEEEF